MTPIFALNACDTCIETVLIESLTNPTKSQAERKRDIALSTNRDSHEGQRPTN